MWAECGRRAVQCGEIFGKTMMIEETMTALIEQAGYVDVVEKRFRWPFGAWAEDKRLKDIGRWQLHHWEGGLEGWTMALMTRCLGVSDQVAIVTSAPPKRPETLGGLPGCANFYVS